MSKKKKKPNMGVYAIINKANGKMYIGSSVHLKNRIYNHKYNLRTNTHPNRYLQNAYNKHGKDNFNIKILEYVDTREAVFPREQYYLDKYKTYEHDLGYNISPVAIGGGGKREGQLLQELRLRHLQRMGKKSGKYKIKAPNSGRYYSLSYPDRGNKFDKKMDSVNILLQLYSDYCNDNWEDHEVKRFLDDIAYYLCDNNKVAEYQNLGFLSRQSEQEIACGSDDYINFADLDYDTRILFDLDEPELNEHGEELTMREVIRYKSGVVEF